MKIIELEEKLMQGHRPDVLVPEGCWVAGGAVRSWFTGEKTSDIDVFAKDEKTLLSFASANNLNEVVQEAEKLITYKYSPPVQLIKRYYPDVEATLDSFDFVICQFAWDGKKIYTTQEAIVSTLRKHLGVHKIQKEFALDSLRRMVKYVKKGYTPCMGTLRDVALVFQSIEKKEEIENQLQYYPNGAVRKIIRWD